MLSRISDVLQSAADVLAPPATRLEDFEYHWKMVLNFYQNYDESSKVHIEDTRVPHHLHQMLQGWIAIEATEYYMTVLADEVGVEEEAEQQGSGAVGPCVEAVVARSVALLDALAAVARADRPAGARATALALAAALLRRTRHPCLHSAHVHRPLQRMLVQCSESPASPTEKEEVELLLTLCGLVRKEPGLANIFTAPFLEDRSGLLSEPEDVQKLIPLRVGAQTPRRNPLFEVEPPPAAVRPVSVVRADEATGADDASAGTQRGADDCDRFLLIDLLLTYLDSADNQVVLRACEGIMIVASLPEDDIANLVTSSPTCERLVERLVRKYRSIPADVDPGDVDHLNITWAYVAHEFGEPRAGRFPGQRQLTAFFSWLDYCDTLAKECHPAIAAHLARAFRDHFLEGAAEALAGSPRRALLATAVLAKSLRAVDSPDLINEFSNWLVGEGEQEEWPLLAALVDNCLGERHDLTLETLRFFEVIVEKSTEHSMDRLVLSRLCARDCREPARRPAPSPPLQDERDRLNDLSFARERERNREAMQQLQHEEHVSGHVGELLAAEGLAAPAPPDLQRTINSLLLLLPRAVLSDPLGAGCEHYVHDAQRHYQLWLDMTASWRWAGSAASGAAGGAASGTASSTHSCDSRPEADLHLDQFRALHDEPRLEDRPRGDEDCPFSQTLVLRRSDAGAEADVEAEAEAERFDEGPFLRMLLRLVRGMPERPYQVNLHLTAIVSKLALVPHPALHGYLLGGGGGGGALLGALRALGARLAGEVPRLKRHRALLQSTRLQLMSEEPAYDETGEHNQLVESLIVLEEFCKELAAIAFVKYQHQAHQHQHQHR